ncbi:NAD-dependent DNA ligase LigA [Candidatus Gracilibacteria bacterium]|nr:MAG: NAD-dependent DNA ligase LigA [Candidatus Gracilibacteria bacterium]
MLELSKKYLQKEEKDFSLKDLEKLQKLIKYHSDLYYNQQNPIISDYEYDLLFKKLQNLEKKFDIKDAETSKVGAEVIESSFEKVEHSRPMISLDNTYNEQDLVDFDERVKKNLMRENIFVKEVIYNLEFKFDGLGIELIYQEGLLVQAITRGNGIIGEDVTENIKQISNIPHQINYKDHLEVRGEVVMPISSFEKLNEESKNLGKKIFSNPRNAASGSVRMKDIKITKKRNLKFFAYDLANFNDFLKVQKLGKYSDVINSLHNLGFEISSYFKKFVGIKPLIDAIKYFGDEKKKIDFEIDGLVLKTDEIDFWEKIGWTEHHPRYAIAYKFPAEILTTKILSVEHSVGRTGTITPVANLEPINIGGVVVKRATLHNYDEVKNLGVKIGDTVFIKRAGEVIPKIISVVETDGRENFEEIKAPEFCPSCKTKVLKDEDKVRFYCPNSFDCPAQHVEKIIFAVGKQGLNIDGLGEKQVELFLELGLINSLASIFDLKNKKDEILALEGFGEKSFTNLINSIEEAKNIDLERFLTSLGIPGVGKKTSKTLKKLFKSKNDFLNFSYKLEDLEELKDIGEGIAKNIFEYFSNESHKRMLSELLEILNLEYYKEESKNLDNSGFFAGKKACITGSFERNGEKISRDSLIDILEKNGGEFVSSVSKNTDFLLAGEKAGSKLEKAKKLGINVIDLDYFFEKVENR